MAGYKESRTPSSKGKQLDHVRVYPPKEGSKEHKVEHHYAEDGMTYHKPKVSYFCDDEHAELMAHIKKYARINESDRPKEDDE